MDSRVCDQKASIDTVLSECKVVSSTSIVEVRVADVLGINNLKDTAEMTEGIRFKATNVVVCKTPCAVVV